MLVLRRKKFFLKIDEVYLTGDHELYRSDADIAMIFHSTTDYRGSREFYTLLIDLTKDETELLSEIHSTTRYIIRKTLRRGELSFSINCTPSEEDIEQFRVFYDRFAHIKGVNPCDFDKLKRLQKAGALTLTTVRDKDNIPLCWVSYIGDGRCTRALYGASSFRDYEEAARRTFIADATKTLHWMNMLHFRNLKYEVYDFGGLALRKDNEELSNIDRFKLGFGGRIATHYYFYKGLTLIGRLALLLSRKRSLE